MVALYGVFNQRNLSRFTFGLVRSKIRAFNVFIDRSNTVWLVEPQIGSIMSTEGADGAPLDYDITHYII